MNVVGLTAQEQNDIFRMLAAILWIGNVQFVDSEDGSGSTITDSGVTVIIEHTLGSSATISFTDRLTGYGLSHRILSRTFSK
jgi:myosin-1